MSGVSSQAPGSCPYTAVCVYTDTYFGGRMFVLYQCRWYSLTNWNGWGSIYNNQPSMPGLT
ncbi:peptidase inhibitor family I36 protein [Micromonospora arida]